MIGFLEVRRRIRHSNQPSPFGTKGDPSERSEISGVCPGRLGPPLPQHPNTLLGPLWTLHRRHPTLRPQHRQTLDRHRRRPTDRIPKNLRRNLPRPLSPSRPPPQTRHRTRPRRHHNHRRLHRDLRLHHRSRHRRHPPSSQHRRHHPRPQLHRQIHVRLNRPNQKRQRRSRSAGGVCSHRWIAADVRVCG